MKIGSDLLRNITQKKDVKRWTQQKTADKTIILKTNIKIL